MMTDAQPERHLAWEACWNVRDLGGYRTEDGHQTRWRALLRADDLCRLTASGQTALYSYGVRTIIDLRSPNELAVKAHPFAAPTGQSDKLVYYSRPLFDDDDSAAQAILKATEDSAEFYCRVLDLFPRRVGGVIATVAQAPDGAVLVHCFAGKDRTGIVVGILLALAGVPHATIAADYALSDSYLQQLYAELLAQVDDPARRERMAREFVSLPETMVTTLAHLETRYGGVEAYLHGAGVTAEQIERVRQRLRQ